MRRIFLPVAAALLFTGCGDESKPADEPSPCVETMTTLCAKACDCREGDGCAIGTPSDFGAVTISFDSPADCEAMYVQLGCADGGGGYRDLQACAANLPAATCEGDEPERFVALPDGCEGRDG